MVSVAPRRAARRAGRPSPSSAAALDRPVISIGNIAMGGRGKTPAAAYVAALLRDAGERPAILSRGYGRRAAADEPVIVSDGEHIFADVDRAGDEPLLLARKVPGAVVVVCAQRALAGAVAEASLGATVHVLDDGFQHASLARDVDIVLVRPEDVVDRRLPFGRLRESVSALARADAVIIDGDDDARVSAAIGAQVPLFKLSRSTGDPLPLEAGREVDVTRGVVAVAGIAEPARFVRSLEDRGIRVAYVIGYRDHHRYTAGDVAHIARAVEQWGAGGVLTTEKDAIRLLPLRPLPMAIAAVPLEITIEPRDAFRSWLLSRLDEARR
jgi:tetraacyldisaccharide 4'-kinase